MRTLAFDTTGPMITIGIADGTCAIGRRDAQADRRKGNILDSLIDELLTEHAWRRRDVEGLGVLTGPGSLTAIRLAWATATGWAQSAGIPVTGWSVPTAHRRRLGESANNASCCVHYRAQTFLFYDLELTDAGPRTVMLTADGYAANPPGFLTGPGVLGRRESWLGYCGPQTTVVSEAEAIIGGDTLALWTAEDLARGDSLSLTSSPLEYGLPPDFKKLTGS